MSTSYQTGWDPQLIGASAHSPSTLVRTRRFASRGVRYHPEGAVEFSRLATILLDTLHGKTCTVLELVVRPTVLMLVEPGRARPERIAAEIGWVRERLEPAIDLVLVWPPSGLGLARELHAANQEWCYLDTTGAFRDLVSPTGARAAVLVEPQPGRIERLSAGSPLFAVDRGSNGRRADHMIDLGDVHH